ncbi:hypothetical protein HRbin13_01163 [bacterium HR13]|nr:hypothetical protein HRbin13_01163 [bacterium HR13]
MGGGIEGEIKGEFIGRFPIPPITPQNQPIVKQIEQLVDKILSLTQCNTGTPACEEASADMNVCATSDYKTSQQKQAQVKALEKQIDELVYELYGLTDEEIKVVESNYEQKTDNEPENL